MNRHIAISCADRAGTGGPSGRHNEVDGR